jgi:hypothetical protein
MFIFVGVGHGIVPMGLIEPMFLSNILKGETVLILLGGYSTRLPACVLLSMLGQIVLLIACISNGPLKFYLTYIGVAILYMALLFLTFDFSSGNSETFTLLFGIPFFYASTRLIVFLIKNNRETSKEHHSR